MDHNDRGIFAALMGQLGEVFSRKITPPLIDVYWEILSRLPCEKFEFAARQWMANGEHFPKPVQLREMAGSMPRPTESALPPPLYSEWRRLANLLMFQWLWRQHSKGIHQTQIQSRAAFCKQLSADFERMGRDPELKENRDLFRECFNEQMAGQPA